MNERAEWDWKGSAGRFRVYLVGKMDWRVTDGDGGSVVAQEQNCSKAFERARWLYEIERTSEPCLDCDSQGWYPNGKRCECCDGIGRVPKGSNAGVIAY